MNRDWTTEGGAPGPLVDVPLAEYSSRRRSIEQQHKETLRSAAVTSVKLSRWDGDLSRRRIRVSDGKLTVECFGTPSTTRRLHVLLSAGGGLLKDGVTPQFPRVSWHPWLDGVAVNIDDPTFAAYPGKLQTGWYLGTDRQDAVLSLAAVIGRIQARYGIAGEDVYVIGSSAGGTAALKVAAAVPGSTAIAENPPIYPHRQSSIKYFKRAGLQLEHGDLLARNDLRHIFDHASSRFFILQNSEDTVIVDQLGSLLAQAGLPLPGAGLNESGSLSLYFTSVPSLSPHHAFLSVDEFRSVLGAVRRGVPHDQRVAVLEAVHEGLRARTLAADRVSNLKGWARVFAHLDVPALADTELPVDSEVVRLSLRARPDVAYRLRLGHQAKNVFMAVDLKRATGATEEEIARAAQRVGARVSSGAADPTMSIARVPLDEAGSRLRSFVDATAHFFG